MSISTVAIITAKPGSGDEVEQILSTLATATHDEEGCQLYSLQRGLEDTDVFVTIERWDSPEALAGHMASAHIAAALGAAGELLAEEPRIVAAGNVGVGDPGKGAF